MAVLSLPLTFNNSFWSQDYKKGLQVLFQKLEQGVAEDDEIVAFIRARAIAEGQLAVALKNPHLTGAPGTGFGADDGASLLMAFRGLQAESVAQGNAHKTISNELHTLVADPFDQWAQSYKARVEQKKTSVFDGWFRAYEQNQAEVAKLKNQYLAKIRKADEAEDDAKFAPGGNGAADGYTTSPRIRPVDAPRVPPQRTASVSERIAQRLKEIQQKNSTSTTSEKEELVPPPPPPVDIKGKGKAVDLGDEQAQHMATSPVPMSPISPPKPKLEIPSEPRASVEKPPMLLADISFSPATVSQLLLRASAEMPLRSVRFPLIGEYHDCFTGEEFVAWLAKNVAGFGGDLDKAEDGARDLTERDGLLRRVGEFGNQLENADDAWYQFRPKAFELGGASKLDPSAVSSPLTKTLPQADKLLKRTNTFVNIVSKALATQQSGPAHVRARQDAEEADKAYRVAIRKLDRHRLGVEENIEETLRVLQRWETERLQAVKTVLLQYQGTLANLPKSLEPSFERSSTLVAAYNPESDLTALIERYRTGPFRPDAQVYESLEHDEPDVLFGTDLRKWADGWYVTEGEKKDNIPYVLTALLKALEARYEKVEDDAEKRKFWIYEVPLPASHNLREALNATIPEPIPTELLANYDAPVIASCIKLWLLELNPPLALYEGWDEIRKLYPTVGRSTREDNPQKHIQELSAALQRLPRIHLLVLDSIIKHLDELINDTDTEEGDEIYITKLALSLGRCVVRPKVETELSIQDRHPTLLLVDLLTNYDEILPPTIARKKRESERKIPIRKRTAPIDMRMSRSRLSVTNVDPSIMLEAQRAAHSGTKSPPPPVPSIPQSLQAIPPPPPPLAAPEPPPAVLTKQPEAPAPIQQTAPPMFTTPSNPDPATGRPAFKEPPPEDDSYSAPPRPQFAEPKPEKEEDDDEEEDSDEDDDDDDDDDEEDDDDEDEDDEEEEEEKKEEEHKSLPMPNFPDSADTGSLPMPNFAEPPPEPASPPPPVRAAIPQPSSQGSDRWDSPANSRAASPLTHTHVPLRNEDEPINPGAKVGLSRTSSNQAAAAAGIRGPRISRGPRAPGGIVSSGTVGDRVANFNRHSVSAISPPGSPSFKRVSIGSGSGTAPPRPSSVLGKAAAFQSRG